MYVIADVSHLHKANLFGEATRILPNTPSFFDVCSSLVWN